MVGWVQTHQDLGSVYWDDNDDDQHHHEDKEDDKDESGSVYLAFDECDRRGLLYGSLQSSHDGYRSHFFYDPWLGRICRFGAQLLRTRIEIEFVIDQWHRGRCQQRLRTLQAGQSTTGGVLMSEQTDTNMYKAFLETVLNHNRDEGATMLAPQGWVNYLNMTQQLAATGPNDDICTTVGWQSDQTNALKEAAKVFHSNTKAMVIMCRHLAAMRIGRLLAPNVEIIVGMFCNKP